MIRYINGDATRPQGDGLKLLAHIVNTSGGWGRGFVLAISSRWTEPERRYREWHKSKEGFVLGEVQFVKVEEDIDVVNMLAQCGYATPTKPAIRYDALEICLTKVAKGARQLGATIHMPRIGCGLAGGTWSEVGKIVEETLHDFDVCVYDPS